MNERSRCDTIDSRELLRIGAYAGGTLLLARDSLWGATSRGSSAYLDDAHAGCPTRRSIEYGT